MSVRNKEEILEAIRGRMSDTPSDEDISFLEDVADTLSDYETRLGEDWKTKYEENDRAWRDKYTTRFFEGSEPSEPENTVLLESTENTMEGPTTFEELFTIEGES